MAGSTRGDWVGGGGSSLKVYQRYYSKCSVVSLGVCTRNALKYNHPHQLAGKCVALRALLTKLLDALRPVHGDGGRWAQHR